MKLNKQQKQRVDEARAIMERAIADKFPTRKDASVERYLSQHGISTKRPKR